MTAAISIHAPRTGSDAAVAQAPSARRISIHAPRTGSDPTADPANEAIAISIHAPRTGSDERPDAGRSREPGFQSTLPARGATYTLSI